MTYHDSTPIELWYDLKNFEPLSFSVLWIVWVSNHGFFSLVEVVYKYFIQSYYWLSNRVVMMPHFKKEHCLIMSQAYTKSMFLTFPPFSRFFSDSNIIINKGETKMWGKKIRFNFRLVNTIYTHTWNTWTLMHLETLGSIWLGDGKMGK